MINMMYKQEIADIIHGPIACSGIEREIIGTPYFNRLHRILQSSLVYLTYPSNKVKRFEHSIGTMHLAGNFFAHSIYNSDEETIRKFFDEINQELIKWNQNLDSYSAFCIHPSLLVKFKNDNILKIAYPKNPIYIQNIPSNLPEKYKFAYCVVYQAIRLVGLLHDIGHLPYSHILEHSIQLLYEKVKAISPDKLLKSHQFFLSVMDKYCSNSDFAIHEELGKKFVEKIFRVITYDLNKREDESIYFLMAVFYFTKQILNSKEQGEENNIFEDLHKIIAGTVDCDRMDYCCRDAYCAGITKDLPNYSRITSNIKMIYRKVDQPIIFKGAPEQKRKRCYFVFSTKAISQIEHLIEKRWFIFSTINYHHRVHKHELLMQRVIAELGMQEMAINKVPDELNDILPLHLSSIWKLLQQLEGPEPIEYIALQLDDSWFDTLLKCKFFKIYKGNYLSFSNYGNDVNWHQLDELISTKKHYVSLIKRSGDFRSFDELLYNKIKESGNLDLFGLEDNVYSKLLNSKREFIFNKLLKDIASLEMERKSFIYKLEQKLKLVIHDDETYNLSDCFLGDCSFKVGISQSEPLFIFSNDLDEKPFSHYSSLYNILMARKNMLPSLHVYFLPRYDDEHSEYYKIDKMKIQTLLVECIIKVMSEIKKEG